MTPTPDDEAARKLADIALYKYTAGSSAYEEEHFRQGYRAGYAERGRRDAEEGEGGTLPARKGKNP